MKFNNLCAYFCAAIVAMGGSGSVSAGVLDDIAHQVPALGLVTDSVSLEGFTVENITFEGPVADDYGEVGDYQVGAKYVIAYPNQVYRVSVDCSADASILENFDLHHLVYGLEGDGPQGCLMHSLGLLDGQSRYQFELRTPAEPGVYQLRFCHATGFCLFESKGDEWWESASANSILGIVVVR